MQVPEPVDVLPFRTNLSSFICNYHDFFAELGVVLCYSLLVCAGNR